MLVRLPEWPEVALVIESPQGHVLYAPEDVKPAVAEDARQFWLDKGPVRLRMGGGPTSWTSSRSDAKQPREAIVSVASEGDNFLLTVLRTWPTAEPASRPPPSVSALRRAIADYCHGTLAIESRRPGLFHWLTALLSGQPPEFFSPSLVTARWRPDHVAGTDADATASASSMLPVEQAVAALDVADEDEVARDTRQGLVHRAKTFMCHDQVARACELLKQVTPPSAIPLADLRLLCTKAVSTGKISAVVALFEHWCETGDVLLPAMGLSASDNVLDLHLRNIFTEHMLVLAAAQGDEPIAASCDLAWVLLELHRARGALGPGTSVAVGRTGRGLLHRAVLEWIRLQGWDASVLVWKRITVEREGYLMITDPAHPALGHAWGAAGLAEGRLLRLSTVLRSSRTWEAGKDYEARCQIAISRALDVAPLKDVVAVLDGTPGVRLSAYMRVAKYVNWPKRVAELEQVLDAIQSRFGPIPPSAWGELLTTSLTTLRFPWRQCSILVNQMKSRLQKPPGVDHLLMLFSSATQPAEVFKAVAIYDDRAGAGLPLDPRMQLALFRAAAMAGEAGNFARFEKVLRGRGDWETVHVRQSRLIMDCRRGHLDQAFEQVDALRASGHALERKALQALLETLWKAGRTLEAGSFIKASADRGEGHFHPSLGLATRSDAPARLRLGAGQADFSDDPKSEFHGPYDSHIEALAQLSWHAKAGHLQAGLEVWLAPSVGVPAVNDLLAGEGLSLQGLRTADGVLRPGYVLVPLDQNAAVQAKQASAAAQPTPDARASLSGAGRLASS